MVVKSKANKHVFYNKIKRYLKKHVGLRWFLLFSFVMLLLLAISQASIYYGIYLQRSGQSMTIKRWVFSLVYDKFSFIPNYISGLFAKPEHIDIDIKFKDYQKLAYKRQTSLAAGQLYSTKDDWVPAKIRYKGETYRASIRLKGSIDHWKREDRWDFRIKLKDNKTLFGMRKFAVQDPRTRNYFDEWYFHKLLEYNGLISLRYDFIDVSVNGKHYPIMAVEENLAKQLVEHNNYREGSIFRFNFFWPGIPGMRNVFWGGVSPYQYKKVMNNEVLKNQFHIAKDLIASFRQGKFKASQVFDVEKLAKFFAITDLQGHHHANSLHNLKLYYNPITSLIEPIGYDNSTIGHLPKVGLFGAGSKLKLDDSSDMVFERWYQLAFQDEELFKRYIMALTEISDQKYLDEFFAHTEEEFQKKLQILHSTDPWYNFKGKAIMYQNQKFIRETLNPIRTLQVYYKEQTQDKKSLWIDAINLHVLPAEVLSLSIGDSVEVVPGKRTILQASVEKDDRPELPVYQAMLFNLPENVAGSDLSKSKLKLNYRILGTTKIRSESVFPWQRLSENFTENDFIRQAPNAHEFEFLTIDESSHQMFIQPGTWHLNRNLIIPKGYLVVCSDATELNLTASAKILSYSPFKFVGSEEHPILIHSSDSTGQGIVIMNTGKESIFEYVIFDNLSNPAQSGWELTGAVTFYEAPVKISYCQFTGNRSEDALNIFRSKFEIDNTPFSETQADAFDGDFVEGKITNSSFVNCGNDAIDVSGSIIDLHNVFMNGIGDKGLSAGENSRITATQIEIKNTELAITSKDISEVMIENVNLDQNRVGFAVFQKKPEFGPASVTVKNLKTGKVEVLYLLEKGSKLAMDEKVMEPSGNNIKDILYGVQYGKSSK